MTLPPNIARVLSKNPNIVGLLLQQYPLGHNYWNYSDDLILEIHRSGSHQ